MSCHCKAQPDLGPGLGGRMLENGDYHSFTHCSTKPLANCTCEGTNFTGCLAHDPVEREMRKPEEPLWAKPWVEWPTEPETKVTTDVKADGAYERIGQKIGALVEQKQAAYGDSFGKSGAVMRILYPRGISDAQLDDALTVVRVLDKLFRIATDRDALGESPWNDIAGYAILSVKRLQK